MIKQIGLKIQDISSRLHRAEDKRDMNAIFSLIKMQEREIFKLKEAKSLSEWGNSEQVRDQQELIQAYENKLGYY